MSAPWWAWVTMVGMGWGLLSLWGLYSQQAAVHAELETKLEELSIQVGDLAERIPEPDNEP
jgi:hypothetical protein